MLASILWALTAVGVATPAARGQDRDPITLAREAISTTDYLEAIRPETIPALTDPTPATDQLSRWLYARPLAP
jgi:hypothetical protein